jgi:hypothetical protein
MVRYKLLVHCNVCDGLHCLPIACSLDNGPLQTSTVAQIFDGKGVPEWLASVSQCSLMCPTTGRRFTPEDNTQILLVPLGD